MECKSCKKKIGLTVSVNGECLSCALTLKNKEHNEQNSNRPKISQEVIDGLTSIIDAQDGKGIAKYGRTIDDADDDDYSWPIMALEEMADYSKYLVREIKRLERENSTLRETVKFLVDKSHKPKIWEDE